MGKILSVLMAAVFVSAVSAQVIEDFEHGNVGLYTATNANLNMSIVPAAAHDGQLGAQFAQIGSPPFYWRGDIPTAPGFQYYGYTRVNTTAGGRMYFGVGASGGGAVSAVAAPNTSQLMLQNNSGWGFVTLQTVPFVWSADTWYRLGIDWAANGDMKAQVFDEGGTLLTETAVSNVGLAAGGIAMRAFNTAGTPWDFDTVTQVPEPASLLGLCVGLIAVAARRR